MDLYENLYITASEKCLRKRSFERATLKPGKRSNIIQRKFGVNKKERMFRNQVIQQQQKNNIHINPFRAKQYPY